MEKEKVAAWVNGAFLACGVRTPPSHLVVHYTDLLAAGGLTFEDVQQEFTALFVKTSSPVAMSSSALASSSSSPSSVPSALASSSSSSFSSSASSSSSSSSINLVNEQRVRSLSGGSLSSAPIAPTNVTADHEAEKAKIQAQIGSRGSVSGMNEDMIREYVEQLYSLTQAEYFVKFSKEAKAFRDQQAAIAEKRLKDAKEYVKELYRVYMKQSSPTESDVSQYVDEILNGTMSLQAVEDHFKLLSLSPPTQ